MRSYFPRIAVLSIITVMFLSSTVKLHGQTLIYDAFIRGDKVGEMKVIREVNDEATKIIVDTHIEAHMLVKIEVDFKSSSTYMDNKLLLGKAETRTNGHLKSSVYTVLKDGQYNIDIDGESSKINKDETTRSSTTMSQTNIQTKREAQTNTSRKVNLVRDEQRLGTSRKQIEPGSNFVFVDGREKSENVFCFYSTKSRDTEITPL